MHSNAVAAVLSGGANNRMGAEKADLQIGGVSFLDRIVGTLRVQFDEVVICGGSRSPEGSTLVADSDAGAGPLAGVVGAFGVADGRDVFLIAVDMPMVDASVIDDIAAPLMSTTQARIARVDGRPQPLCSYYGAALGPYAARALRSDDRSMMAFLRTVPHLTLMDVEGEPLRNINTPEDYERLISAMGGRGSDAG